MKETADDLCECKFSKIDNCKVTAGTRFVSV